MARVCPRTVRRLGNHVRVILKHPPPRAARTPYGSCVSSYRSYARLSRDTAWLRPRHPAPPHWNLPIC
eukprot:500687-Prymnesium_polylepis.1